MTVHDTPRFDFRAERSPIELDGLFATAIKEQIGLNDHGMNQT